MNMNYKMILMILLSIGIGYIHGLSCICSDRKFQPHLDIETGSNCDVSEKNISNLFLSLLFKIYFEITFFLKRK